MSVKYEYAGKSFWVDVFNRSVATAGQFFCGATLTYLNTVEVEK